MLNIIHIIFVHKYKFGKGNNRGNSRNDYTHYSDFNSAKSDSFYYYSGTLTRKIPFKNIQEYIK